MPNNAAIRLAREVEDQATVDLLTNILKMEEGHVDWAEQQRAQIEQTAILQARILAATPEEVASSLLVVEAALKHPLMERARKAATRGQCRRETPVSLRETDGSLTEGVVDLAFLEDQAWVVVDFKTDREVEGQLETYRRQVGLYAAAIASATGQPASAVLMRV